MSLINEYLGISNGKARNLEYIYKLMNLQEKFNTLEIRNWYCNCNENIKDIKVDGKPSVSINFTMLSSPSLVFQLEDELLTILLLDCNDEIDISIELELRIVNIINIHGAKLHKYVKNYTNRLEFKFNINEIIKINNNCSYYLVQDILNLDEPFSTYKSLLSKLKNQKYKEQVEKYIESQGILNDTIFIHAIVLDAYFFRYISNVNIEKIYSFICYKHLSNFIKRSQLTQQYLVSLKDQNCLLKYPNFVELTSDILFNLKIPRCLRQEELIYILLSNRKKLTQSEIQLLMALDKPVLVDFLLSNSYNLTGTFTKCILSMENRLDLTEIYERYGIELAEKNIEPSKGSNKQIYRKFKQLLEIAEGVSDINLEDKSTVLVLLNKYKSYNTLNEIEKTRLLKYFLKACSLKELSPLILELQNPSNEINEFVLSNLEQIDSSDLKKEIYKKFSKENKTTDTYNPYIRCSENYLWDRNNIKKSLELFSTEKACFTSVESFLKTLFSDYDFDYYSDYLPQIIKNLQKDDKICRLIFLIQENIRNILEIGFFRPSYFTSIKNVINTIIKYRAQDNCNYCSKVRRNTDKIIVLLSFFSKHFDKKFQIGTVSHNI